MRINHRNRMIAETAGWYGTIAIICAYAMASFGIVSAESIIFQLLNLSGAAGIIAIAVYKKVKQSIVLNIFWGIVAIAALTRIIFTIQ